MGTAATHILKGTSPSFKPSYSMKGSWLGTSSGAQTPRISSIAAAVAPKEGAGVTRLMSSSTNKTQGLTTRALMSQACGLRQQQQQAGEVNKHLVTADFL
jgi:hypothetical protein